jgi:hypothetical protein
MPILSAIAYCIMQIKICTMPVRVVVKAKQIVSGGGEGREDGGVYGFRKSQVS